jgi:hypothetical protein
MSTIEPHTAISSDVTSAYAQLVERIHTNKPHPMPGWHVADALDLEDRAEHLRRLLTATEDYVRAVMVDMKRSANIFVDADVTGGLADLQGDVVGTLLNCADTLRGVASGRAA